MKCGAEAAAKQYDASLAWQAPPSISVADASSTLRSIGETKPNGIMFEGGFSATGFASQIAGLMQQGIPVAIVDSPTEPQNYYQSFTSDNKASGAIVAKNVNELVGGSGEVGVITAEPGTPERLRYTVFAEALKSYPKIRIVSVQNAKSTSSSTAAQDAAAMMTGNPNLKLIYTTDGPLAQGAEAAIKAANKQGSVKLISFDATPEEVQAVQSGQLTGLVAQSPYLMGFESVKALIAKAKEGSSGPVQPLTGSQHNVTTPFLFVTKQNVNSSRAKTYFEYPASCPA